MTKSWMSVSFIALVALIVPSLLYFWGWMSLLAVQWIALLGTFAWFLVTPLWMGRQLDVDADQVEI
jgi:hypothetical protein